MAYQGDRWVQVGLTSFGGSQECNRARMPSVYTKVSAFIDWINNIIAQDGEAQ